MKIAKYTSGFALMLAILSVILIMTGEVTKHSETESSSTSVSASTIETTIQTTIQTTTTIQKTVMKVTKNYKANNTTKGTIRLTTKDIKNSEFEVPNIPDFKSWTNYHYVSRNSSQWRVLTGDNTYTDDNGFRRKGSDYLVAMGSYYTKTLGDRFKVTTNKGNVFTVTICDWKADCDTDSKGQYTLANNCMIEFYVDDNLCNAVRNSGSCSSIKELSGKITKIEKIK